MEDINILLETASSYCLKGDFKQGIHLYSKYIEADQSYPIAFYQRGKAYFKIKDYNAALSDLTKAIALQPEEAHFFGERGLIYYMAQNSENAIADFDHAVALEPENPFRYASRAFIKDSLGDLEGAKIDYQKAIEIDPEDAISHNNLGLVLEKAGYKNKADAHYEKAGKLDPKSFGMRSQLSDDANKAVPEEKEKPAPLPKINPSKEKNTEGNFMKTLKGLASSKEERKEFWDFFKKKIKGN